MVWPDKAQTAVNRLWTNILDPEFMDQKSFTWQLVVWTTTVVANGSWPLHHYTLRAVAARRSSLMMSGTIVPVDFCRSCVGVLILLKSGSKIFPHAYFLPTHPFETAPDYPDWLVTGRCPVTPRHQIRDVEGHTYDGPNQAFSRPGTFPCSWEINARKSAFLDWWVRKWEFFP